MAKGKFEYWLTSEGLLKLEAWARDGLIDEQIAENAGITPSTLYEWKKKYPDISEALKKGKEVVDIQVENALLKRALGYSYKETKTEETADGDRRLYQIPLHRYSGLRTGGQISGGISRTLSTADR